MSQLCDGQAAEIIETGWCVYPVWYSGGEEDSVFAFNAIKDAIIASNNILNGEIQLAKRFKDTRRIGKKAIVLLLFLIFIFSAGNNKTDATSEMYTRSAPRSRMHIETPRQTL